MKKIIAVVALLTAAAAPVAPVHAATLADVVDSCLVLPLLKSECWPAAGERPVIVTTSSQSTARAVSWPLPAWWNCTRAEEGAGHLYDCQ